LGSAAPFKHMPTSHLIRPYNILPQKVEALLNQIATPVPEKGNWIYTGSLDNLYQELGKVKAMFYAYPEGMTEDNVIFVTSHSNWGVR